MEFTKEEIRRHIDEYARLTALAAEIDRRIDDEKVYFTQLAERDLRDSKVKTKRYYGETARVTATTACTVKINKSTALERLFGAAYRDYVKTEVKTDIKGARRYELCALFKRRDFLFRKGFRKGLGSFFFIRRRDELHLYRAGRERTMAFVRYDQIYDCILKMNE